MNQQKSLNFFRNNFIIVLFALLFIASSFAFPSFFTLENIGNLVRMAAINGLLAAGVTYVIICGSIDISVGSVMAFSGCIIGWMSNAGLEIPGVILALLSGVFSGFLIALMIVQFKMPPFIASLVIMQSVRGIVFITTNYEQIGMNSMSPGLAFIGRGAFMNIFTVPALIMAIVMVVTSYIFRRTNIGRSMYAVGGNIEAAKMMGLKVDWTRYFAHMMCGGLAALAGLVLACRMGAVSSVTGEMAEMQAIAATVLGGTLLTGGVGKISGTFFGVMFIATLTNFFNMLSGVNTFWQQVITGFLLLVVVLSQSISKDSAFRKIRKTEEAARTAAVSR
ncbi:MAG: ABC transporter permease [Christensenellales bacterium]|jgi:ribose/xylose/arabinose/galactoside ABC-type transport system permease subunit